MAKEDQQAEEFDIVVIGAGVFGLVCAKTYLDVVPHASLLLVDSAASIGGTWALERHYPGLKTQSTLGYYEYADFPMDDFGAKKDEHISAQAVQRYLQAYITRFGFESCVRLKTEVRSATWTDEKDWLLQTRTVGLAGGDLNPIRTQKLIVATGPASNPFVPNFEGEAQFGRPIFHSQNFKPYEKDFEKSNSVVVLSAGKAGWDYAYACAMAGKEVHWVIRESGHGPVWMTPIRVSSLKILNELLSSTRFLNWFSPSVWGQADTTTGARTLQNFFHRTKVGRRFVEFYFWYVAFDLRRQTRLNKHPETKKLKAWHKPFWVGGALGVLNYDTNFFALVRDGKMKIHIADITRLEPGAVHLADSSILPADLLVCCTGHVKRPPFEFLPKGLEKNLGLPQHEETASSELLEKVNAQIFKKFPMLMHQPEAAAANPLAPPPLTPHRLYRFMIPPDFLANRSIAFAGALFSVVTTTTAQAQALWIAAYFQNKLPHLTGKTGLDVEEETLLHSQFCKLRSPHGHGGSVPDILFEARSYNDLVLGELGVCSHRKGSTFKEWFQPYGSKDYQGLTDEWLRQNGDVIMKGS